MAFYLRMSTSRRDRMEKRNNKVLPWVTFAATVIYAIAYVLMMIGLEIEIDTVPLRIIVFTTLGLSVVTIVLALVTAKVNKVHDPMTARVDSLSSRYTTFAVILSILPIFIQLILFSFVPAFADLAEGDPARATFLMTVITIYVTGFPILLLSLRKVPAMKIEKRNMKFSFFILCIAVMAGLCLAGICIGLPIELLLTSPFEDAAEAADDVDKLAEILMQSSFFDRVLVTGVLAPIFEELIFRKLLVSRTIRYGETFSILLSGFMFGLFHGNFQQFFFAMFVGMLFAFVFIRTGKVIYPILMHMTVNLSTSIVTTSLYIKLMPYLDDADNMLDLPADMRLWFLVLMFWLLLLFSIALTGFVLLFVFNKRFKPYKSPDEPSMIRIIGNSIQSPLFWSFIVICIADFASAYLPNIAKYFMNNL